MKKSIYVVNGPNLNLLGKREPEIYGKETLADIEKEMQKFAEEPGWDLHFFQSNIEGEIIDHIQKTVSENADGLIINPGGLTHTSISILDALLLLKIPIVEVHLSQIYKREEFRQKSYVSKASTGVVCGFGAKGYILALEALK
jgi:3-dehydroquinate dehydratase-2